MYNINGISKFKLVFIVALCDFASAIKLVSFNTRPRRGVPTADLDFLLDIWIFGRTFTLEKREGVQKTQEKSLVFCQTGGGEVRRRVVKTKPLFWKSIFAVSM